MSGLNLSAKTEAKRLYIVHGYDASPKSHWFVWLQNELNKFNVQTQILTMPTPAKPRLNEWLETLKNEIKFEGRTYLIGHSLGCPTILNFLQRYAKSGEVSGVLLVSGLAKPLKGFEILDEFMDGGFDFELLKTLVKYRAVIAAKDDYIVPFELTKELSQSLDAAFYEVQKGGHFLDRDGFSSFDLALEVAKKMMNL